MRCKNLDFLLKEEFCAFMAYFCQHCLKELTPLFPIGRLEDCPNCGAFLHCCKNCEFYDAHAYNECREIKADRVLDKFKNNFCDYYKLASQVTANHVEKNTKDEALEKLKALFK